MFSSVKILSENQKKSQKSPASFFARLSSLALSIFIHWLNELTYPITDLELVSFCSEMIEVVRSSYICVPITKQH